MPAQCSSCIHPASSAPIPCTLGYAAYLDDNMDSVFTCLDMATMDHCDVVPFTTPKYPSHNNVGIFLALSFDELN